MAKKEDLFGKLNIKDYNNYLEEILETKNFSLDTKNLLLSMLYKIETAYNDYSTVKNLNKSKREFVEEIIETVKNNCEKIELVRPLEKEYAKIIKTNEKCIVNKEKKEITSLYNEQALLYAISKLKNNEYRFKNEILKEPLKELLDNGKDINEKEVIRDFDGWAWHIETKQIENVEYNLIYQNILILIGEEIKSEKQIKENLSKTYEKKDVRSFFVLLCKIALKMYLNNHEKEKKKVEIERNENQKKFEELEDKVTYLKNISTHKKRIETKIKHIDKCLTDSKLLKEEYIKTNNKLKENEKIFSISDFAEKIQQEKDELLFELQKDNKKMQPSTYLREKEKLQEKVQILSVIEENKNIYEYILNLQQVFILGIQEKIKQAQTRKEMMDIIYRLRYYKTLPYKDTTIKNVKELGESIYQTEKMIYNKACKMNIINQISINEKVNIDVLIDILDTSIIELENIEILFKAENYQINLKIFDEENIERTIEYDTIEGLMARMNKKIRLFIK